MTLLTITLNASVDVSYKLSMLQTDTTNRVSDVDKTAGGKGLNVGRVAHLLGLDTQISGIVGGTTGDYIKSELNKSGINYNFYESDQESRHCIAIIHENKQTEILEKGPLLNPSDQEAFLEHFQSIIPDINYLTISGSNVPGFSKNVYARMIEMATQQKCKVFVDTNGATLKTLLADTEIRPFLIKPNKDELSDLLEMELPKDRADMKRYLNNPMLNGIQWIICSLGKDGALVKHHNNYYIASIPSVSIINPVGSGDATIAGLAYGFQHFIDEKEIISSGMAAGIANAMEHKTGFLNKNMFNRLRNEIFIQKI